ncbi:MAG: fibronectin type III domain-containing protein [bacterium]|nr:fibronectin type III domain-containing protein [bacterium]
MNNEVKIPTLLGLGVLLTGLVIGVFLVTQNQSLKSRASQPLNLQNMALVNLSDTQASVYWQTDQESTGFVQAGTTPSLDLTFKDERDLQPPQNHRLHFVTLKNLTPQTTYYYKIHSGAGTYPAGNPLTFTTAASLPLFNYNPLVSTVINNSSQPVSEALVTLEIPGAQKLATITKLGGNFILPLTGIKTADFSESFRWEDASSSATMTVFDNGSSSRLTLPMPLQNITLPTIILGQDLDLAPKVSSPSPEVVTFDLNGDGVINSLDLGVVLKNYGKKNFEAKADLNKDGKVDQKDVKLINKAIPNSSPR